ncbi:MAG: hypothetical protein IJ512_05765 [Ruminococcus sp.]|nr:hypothetical protein [Ruminococcus sp.]
MEKNTYRNMMAHIRMSEACEQEILRKAAEASEQKPITMKTKKKRSFMLAAAAACLCVALLGTVTASAIQDRSWLSGFFYVPEWEGESAEVTAQREEVFALTEEYISELNGFTATGWNADKFEPIGAVCDGRNLYIAIRYTTAEEDGICAEQLYQYYEYLSIESEGRETNSYYAESSSHLQEDGSVIIYESIFLDEALKGDSVEITMGFADHSRADKENFQIADSDVCHAAFSVDIAKKAKVITYYVDDILKKEIQPLGVNACLFLEQAEVSCFYTMLRGTETAAHQYAIERNPVSVITKDGEEVECLTNYGVSRTGGRREVQIQIEYITPLDPTTIAAIRVGDQIIELD